MILSLDASTAHGSVALVQREQVTRELFPDTPRGRGGALFSALEELLREAPTIRRVVVGVGPGSYNGIRSAIAVAWGIATARKIPLVGISSLLGLDDGRYFAVGDARREQYFLAQVRRGTFISEPTYSRGSKLKLSCTKQRICRSSLRRQSSFSPTRSSARRAPPSSGCSLPTGRQTTHSPST